MSGGERWLTLREVIDLFVAMGCEPREIRDRQVEPGGSWTIHFLYNAEAETFVALRNLQPESLIAPSVLDSWERRLRTPVPRPGKTH